MYVSIINNKHHTSIIIIIINRGSSRGWGPCATSAVVIVIVIVREIVIVIEIEIVIVIVKVIVTVTVMVIVIGMAAELRDEASLPNIKTANVMYYESLNTINYAEIKSQNTIH